MQNINRKICIFLATSALASATMAKDMAYSLGRVVAVPEGAEVTGLAMNGDDLFLNYQHPNAENPAPYNNASVGVFSNISLSAPLAAPQGADIKTLTSSLGPYQILMQPGTDGIGVINGETSDAPDFNSYIPQNDRTGYLFTNWEETPGGMSRVLLTRGADGKYAMSSPEMIDFSAVNGTWINCFGSTSPWNTPLSSEELYFDNTSDWNNKDYEEIGEVEDAAKSLGHYPNPYDYGYIVEITDPLGTPKPVKHFAMGRLSHENSVVMPDNKTAYMSDDGTGTVFFKFVADKPNDLSAGTLYAAKITQNGAMGADLKDVTFGVEWVELAHGDEQTISTWIRSFDGITQADYGTDKTYITDEEIAAWANGQASDDRAAFLESRKAAVAKGATGEFRKMEGVRINYDAAKNGTAPYVYMAMSQITKTMSDTEGSIQLSDNPCGAVFKMELDAEWNIAKMVPWIVGGPYDEAKAPNACNIDNISEPDNVLVMNDGSVLIGEDSGEHQNNFLWHAK